MDDGDAMKLNDGLVGVTLLQTQSCGCMSYVTMLYSHSVH